MEMPAAAKRPAHRRLWIVRRLAELAAFTATCFVALLRSDTGLEYSLRLTAFAVLIYHVVMLFWPIAYLSTYLRSAPPFVDTLVFILHGGIAAMLWFNSWTGFTNGWEGALPGLAAWGAAGVLNISMTLWVYLADRLQHT